VIESGLEMSIVRLEMPLADNGRSGGHESASANHHDFTKKELLGIFCAACNYNCRYLSTASKQHLMAEMTAIGLSVPLENPDRTFLYCMMYLHYSMRRKDPGHDFLTWMLNLSPVRVVQENPG